SAAERLFHDLRVRRHVAVHSRGAKRGSRHAKRASLVFTRRRKLDGNVLRAAGFIEPAVFSIPRHLPRALNARRGTRVSQLPRLPRARRGLRRRDGSQLSSEGAGSVSALSYAFFANESRSAESVAPGAHGSGSLGLNA